jgi:hypothetical protein
MNSCLSLATFNNGKTVTTIEGLATDDQLHPLQEAFVAHDAMQCGYCTPGQIMSGIACIREKKAGSREDIQRYMSGNICRCGAYQNIVFLENDSPRAEAIEKVTGRAKYAAEHRIENMAYGVFVCSTIAKGTILSIEEGPARSVEGVLDIISFKNCPSTPGYEPLLPDGNKNPRQWWGLKVLYDNIVRFYGQPVALVVADSLENANAAAQVLTVQYQRQCCITRGCSGKSGWRIYHPDRSAQPNGTTSNHCCMGRR